MKARQFSIDPETLKPVNKDEPKETLAKDIPSEVNKEPEPKIVVQEVSVDDLAPHITTEQAGIQKAYEVFKLACEGGISGEDSMKQAIETYLKLSPPKVYNEKGVKSLNSEELLTELAKIPLSWKPYSYTLNRVITKRDLILLNMILEESAEGNNETLVLKPDGVPLVRKKLDAIRFDVLARHYKL
jgi:hypothetical protein